MKIREGTFNGTYAAVVPNCGAHAQTLYLPTLFVIRRSEAIVASLLRNVNATTVMPSDCACVDREDPFWRVAARRHLPVFDPSKSLKYAPPQATPVCFSQASSC